ncbi:MAG: hypothetical protein Hals2KO_14930 [Halioglobus sp.]
MFLVAHEYSHIFHLANAVKPGFFGKLSERHIDWKRQKSFEKISLSGRKAAAELGGSGFDPEIVPSPETLAKRLKSFEEEFRADDDAFYTLIKMYVCDPTLLSEGLSNEKVLEYSKHFRIVDNPRHVKNTVTLYLIGIFSFFFTLELIERIIEMELENFDRTSQELRENDCLLYDLCTRKSHPSAITRINSIIYGIDRRKGGLKNIFGDHAAQHATNMAHIVMTNYSYMWEKWKNDRGKQRSMHEINSSVIAGFRNTIDNRFLSLLGKHLDG